MNKKELIQAVAATTGLTQKEVSTVVEALIGTIATSVANSEPVAISGLGTFTGAWDVPARTARNPKTGEALEVAASRRSGFKFSAPFKRIVKAGPVDPSPQV